MTNYLVCWNSKSGRAKEVDELQRLLRGESCDWLDLASVSDLESTIKSYAQQGC